MRGLLTIAAVVMISAAAWGQSIVFDAALSQYTEIPYTTTLASLGPMSVAAWVNFDGYGTDRYHSVLSCGGVWQANTPFDCGVREGTVTDNAYFYFRKSSTLYGGEAVLTGEFIGDWHHFVWVRDAAFSVYIYLDGVLRATDSGNQAPTDGSHNLRVGAWSGTQTSSEYFPGELEDPVRFYHYALTANEVAALYQKDAERLNWLGSRDLTEVLDLSGNGNIGTPSDTAIISYSGERKWQLDGRTTAGYISASDFTIGTNAWTISARIKSINNAASFSIAGQLRSGAQPHGFGLVSFDQTGDRVYAVFEHSAGAEWYNNLYYDWTGMHDEWHTVTASISEMGNTSDSAVGKLYVDGVLVDSYTNSTAVYEPYKFFIGASDNGSGSASGSCGEQIDDVLIYQRELASNEVTSIHAGNPPSDTYRYYDMTPALSAGMKVRPEQPLANIGGTNVLTEIPMRPSPLVQINGAVTNAWTTYDGQHTITPYNGPTVGE